MTIAAHTGKTETRACSKCGVEVLHREIAALSCGPGKAWWAPEAHAAECGLPCMAGSLTLTQYRDGPHGYGERCPRCGPLRVLPEVAEEMRARATATKERAEASTPGKMIALFAESPADAFALAADVLRCLDEIDKLTRERDDARQALDEARDQTTALRMEMADREIDAEEPRHGVAIAEAIDLLESFIVLQEPGSQTREVGDAALAKARAELRAVTSLRARAVRSAVVVDDELRQRFLEDGAAMAQAEAAIAQEQDEARARCAAEGHTPEWLSCDPYSADKDYQCTRCGDHLPEPEDDE